MSQGTSRRAPSRATRWSTLTRIAAAAALAVIPPVSAAAQATVPPDTGVARRIVDSLADTPDLAARGEALLALGRAREATRDREGALAAYRGALRAAEQRRDSAATALARHSLGAAHFRDNQYDSAVVHLQVARALRTALGDRPGLASTLNSLGAAHYQVARYESALEAFLESLELRRAEGDRPGITRVLTNIGKTYQDWKRFDRALPIFEEAIATSDSVTDPFGAGYALNSIGRFKLDRRDYDSARRYLERSLSLYRSTPTRTVSAGDSTAGWIFNTIDLALLHVRTGDPQRALTLLDGAQPVAARIAGPREEARVLLVLGEAHGALGHETRAIGEFRTALAIARASGQRVMALEALTALADLEEARGNTGAALRDLRDLETLRAAIFDDVTAQRIASMEARAENERLRLEQQAQAALISRQRVVVALGALVLVLAAVLVWELVRNNRRSAERQAALSRANAELNRRNEELSAAMAEVRTLTGFIPICANCKNVRDDKGFWEAVESYVGQRSSAMFSHSLCPNCGPALYGEDWTPDAPSDAPPDAPVVAPATGPGTSSVN